ncbi:MAG: AAA family ATPase [Syntrophomonas sp.]
MNEVEITIRNCNNIDFGAIHIEEGRLNIKYAINGTGKSTIAQALTSMINGEDLSYLRPFKYTNDNIEEHNPFVSSDFPINKIAIFDENYINTYAFKKNELLENSFEIFVKTDRYDQHMEEINSLIASIQTAFKNDPALEVFIEDLGKFVDSFGKAQNGYSKSGDLGKSIGKGNKIENVPAELTAYAPYLKTTGTNIKWLKWQSEGHSYLDITDKCPYCVSRISTPKEIILKVSEEYDVKYLATLSKILEVFDSLNAYFSDETKEAVKNITSNSSEIATEQINYLKRLKEEVIQLREKLYSLKYLGFNTLKDVDRVIDALNGKKIDLNFYPQLNCDYTKAKINTINCSLDTIIEKAGQLQGQIAQQKNEIRRTIERYSNEINGFLSSAGYQYEVTIEQSADDNNYRLILKFSGGTNEISDVRSHLSYGERNAFALVLFMYQTLKEQSDFIILDDPISSFDKNKKYAIMSMLFMGDTSMRGKTVLMLTHDFEPIIDSVYNLPHLFQPAAKASFIGNIAYVLDEKPIVKSDIKSCITVCRSNIDNSTDIIHKLIYCRRLLEMQDDKNIAWQLVSNVFHKDRDIPKIKPEGETELRDMTSEEIDTATQTIQFDIPDFDYSVVYPRTKNVLDMINLYHNTNSGYEKVQIYRILFDGRLETGSTLKKYVDETFHVQNDYLFQLNPREYKIVPQYVIDFCDSDINSLELDQA